MAPNKKAACNNVLTVDTNQRQHIFIMHFTGVTKKYSLNFFGRKRAELYF